MMEGPEWRGSSEGPGTGIRAVLRAIAGRGSSVGVLVALVLCPAPLSGQETEGAVREMVGRYAAAAGAPEPARLVEDSGSELAVVVRRFEADEAGLMRRWDAPWSRARRERLRVFYSDWQDRLREADYAALDLEARIEDAVANKGKEATSQFAAEIAGVDQLGIGSDMCRGWDGRTLDWMRNGRWRFVPEADREGMTVERMREASSTETTDEDANEAANESGIPGTYQFESTTADDSGGEGLHGPTEASAPGAAPSRPGLPPRADDPRYYHIKGDYLTVRFEHVKTINVDYLHFYEKE